MKRFYLTVLVLLTGILFNITALSQDTVRIGDLGLKPDTRENAVLFVQKALEACKAKKNPILVFPKGRYDFWPQYAIEKLYYESGSEFIPLRRCAILIEDMKNLTIDCMGSDFVFHDRIQPFTVDKSHDIIIKNVSIDWDIPMTAQAEIMEVTDNYIDIAINVLEFPYTIENDKLVFLGEGWKSTWKCSVYAVMEFDRQSRLVVPNTGDLGCLGEECRLYKARELKYGLVRLHYAFKRKPAKGNYLVLRHSARDHAGTFIIDSKDVTIENMNMYHNAGMGILSQYSENLTFRKVNIIPNPAKNRIFSGHDDGLNYSNCKGLITVDNCRLHACMDDPVNVHGTYPQILKKKNDRLLVCRFIGEGIGFIWARVGEKVGLIENETMNTIGTGIVESFKAISPELFEITFKDPVPLDIIEGDDLENLTWTPDVIIRNSFFGSCRARGILMSTPGKVEIENNVFESSGSAILIGGDANYWYESGAVADVLIRNNIFNDPCMSSMYQYCEGIISIKPNIPKLNPDKPFNRNIRIENNEFHPFDYPVLYAKSVDDLSFTGNTLIRSYRFQPFHKRKSTLTFEFCRNIKVTGNKLEGEIIGKNIQLISTPVKQLKIEKKQGFVVEKSLLP